MERKPKTTKEMKGKAGRIKEKGKGNEDKKERALKGIKEKTETIGKKEGKKRG